MDTGIIFALMLLGPSASGLTMTAHMEGRAGLRRLWLSLARWHVGMRWQMSTIFQRSGLCCVPPAAGGGVPWAAPQFLFWLFIASLKGICIKKKIRWCRQDPSCVLVKPPCFASDTAIARVK
jgi:hypothetical protein